MFFDARAAKLMKPGEHMVIDGCQGLRLEASASRKTWIYRYKAADGRMKQVKLGEWPAVPVQAAAARWQELREQRAAGVDPGAERRATRQAQQEKPAETAVYTVRRLVLDYIEGHIEHNRQEAGALAAKRALHRLLDGNEEFAARPAASITRGDAFDLLDRKKATPTAAQKLRSELGSAWDYALDADRLPGDSPNWWRMVMRGRLKSRGKIIGGEHVGRQRRTLRETEIAALLTWLPNMHELGRDVTQMYLWTCARGVEILGMRPQHITREGDGWWWTVPKEQTKNARFENAVDLRVPLVGRALAIVRRRLDGVGVSGWMFEDVRQEQYTQHDYSTYIYGLQPYSEKVRRRESEGLVVPVEGWTPHDLRRTGRTVLASLGCPNEIGEAILGHLPSNIVGIYNAHTYDAERRHWLGRLSDCLEGLDKAHDGLPARP